MRLLVLFLLAVSTSCSSPSGSTQNGSSKSTLEAADSVQLGVPANINLNKALATPAGTQNIGKFDINALLACVMYPCAGYITAFVDDTETVKLVFWAPQAGDPSDIDSVKNHYVGVSFTAQRVLYNFGDYMYEVENYKSNERGITITVDPVKRKVIQVLREDPKSPVAVAINSEKKLPIVTILPERDTAGSFQ